MSAYRRYPFSYKLDFKPKLKPLEELLSTEISNCPVAMKYKGMLCFYVRIERERDYLRLREAEKLRAES